MNVPVIIPGQLFSPLVVASASRSAAQNQESSNGVAEPALKSTLQTVLNQTLGTAGDPGVTGDNLFISSLQSVIQSSALTASLANSPGQTATALDSVSQTPLLLQALGAEDRANASGEIPFTAPYQLGLQATTEFASQLRSQSQTNLAPSGVAQAQEQATAAPSDLGQTGSLDTLAGAAEVATAGVADPTASTLFQAHSGALATNLFLTSGSLPSGTAAETPASLKVTEAYAGAATSAFSEGQPANPNVSVLNATVSGRLSANPLTIAAPVETVAPTYGPEGIANSATRPIGASLDMTG